ncbi:MAG TPA: MFS transporter [Candidatus Limnocylindria bacterium]|nr:MFS transporter [Candidatus Limnocylindria bacterium]
MAEVNEAARLGLLRNRAFTALWGAQILSQTAANAVTSALIILVAELTHSNTSSSFLILLAIIPAVLFGFAGGVVVDRSDRRLVLVVTNALRAAAVVPLILAGESVTTAYLVNFLVATVTIFFVPAEAATIPSIVRKRDLLVANSLFTFTFNGAFLVGFIILAPVVVNLYGFYVLWFTVVTMFAIASLLCLTLPPAPPAPSFLSVELAERAVSETRRGISEAFHYLRSTPLVTWAMVYIALTYTLVAIAGALAPGFVREVLRLGERNVVVLVAPAGVGVVAGLGLLNVVSGRIGRSHAIGAGLMVTTVALVVLAAARPFADVFAESRFGGALGSLGGALPFFIGIVSVTAFVFGIAYSFITVPSMTLLQEELPEDIRGRVFGVLNSLVSIFSFLPLIIVGPIADVWGVAPVFVLAAAIVFGLWLAGRAERLRAGRGTSPNVTDVTQRREPTG